jgi:hypothetical protein
MLLALLAASLLQQPVAAASALPLVLLLPAVELYVDPPSPLLLLPSCQGSASADTDPSAASTALL